MVGFLRPGSPPPCTTTTGTARRRTTATRPVSLSRPLRSGSRSSGGTTRRSTRRRSRRGPAAARRPTALTCPARCTSRRPPRRRRSSSPSPATAPSPPRLCRCVRVRHDSQHHAADQPKQMRIRGSMIDLWCLFLSFPVQVILYGVLFWTIFAWIVYSYWF